MYEDDSSGSDWVVTRDWKTKKRKRLKLPSDSEQAELLRTAIEKKLKGGGESGVRLRCAMREYRHVYDRRDRQELHALNPYAGAIWAAALEEAVAATGIEGQAWFVTIIDDAWSLGTTIYSYSIGPSPEALSDVLKQMRRTTGLRLRGVPFLLQADFAVRRVVGHWEPSIEVHWHGLVWTDKATIGVLQKRFPANKIGAPGMKAKAVYGLSGALAYAVKDSRLGYVTVQNRHHGMDSSNRKRWFHHRDTLQSRHRWMLVGMTADLTKPELCSASGEGRIVLRKALQIVKEQGYRRPSR